LITLSEVKHRPHGDAGDAGDAGDVAGRPATVPPPDPSNVAPSGYQRLSLWWEAVPAPLPARPALTEDLDVDVCIVGGGFTGLWTAHALARADPSLRIVVLEREVAGFGASGRNGGWCSALFATSDAALERKHGHDAMVAMRRAMQATVDEVGAAAAKEGIDCHFAKGGSVDLVRSEAQRARALAEVEEARTHGFGEEDLRWLAPEETRALVDADGALGATFTPHCAALQPALLARGLADAVGRRGVRVCEHTAVTAIRPAPHGPTVATAGGTVRAEVVVRATEAWTPTLPGLRRALVPVYSLMVATEPLPEDFWARAGLAGRATFADYRHMIIYGQRTADGRIAFGGRGAPYHYGSAVRPTFDREPDVHALLRRTLVELFPELAHVRFTHAWGGPLGIPRDWHSSVGFDRSSGLAWAGGYVGDGVATTNLAGRTLADLITDADTDLTRLPWVDHRSPPWEPEPLRWVGVNAGLWAMKLADRSEARHGRPSHVANAVGRWLGQ
jgi:glycine/D-amino acid oxidase-like deaminating enzyme